MAKRSERQRDAQRKRAVRSKGRLVIVPPCADRARRARLEADDEAWLMYYWGPGCGCDDPFTYDFTSQQRDMIRDIGLAAREAEDAADAASRGEGKTTLFRRLLCKYVLQGILSFPVILGATRDAANDSLEQIKQGFETNRRLLRDYPEVCVPVRALENTPNRAHYMLVTGLRHDNSKPYVAHPADFSWCGNEIRFPNVPGAPSRRAMIATRGLDSEVRGLNKGRRPDLAAIDDPDTEETVNNEIQRDKLMRRIEKAIGFLGKQNRRCGRIMLTTLQSRTCASAIYTDPTQKPSWRGKRFRYLIKPPARVDLWDEYVTLKQDDWRNGTNHAHELYVEKRAEMDAGAKVANPNRHSADQLSALQNYYDEVARKGPEAVATELDNDPPEEDGPVESGITATRIQKRLSGYPRGIVPPECRILSRGIDVQKAGLHWVVKAWRSDATHYVIDYGFFETHGTTYNSEVGVEHAIYRALTDYMEQSVPYLTPDGEERRIGLTLVDSGWQDKAVIAACREIRLGIYPAKGHGKSHGCATPNFYEQTKETKDRKPGDGWFQSKIKQKAVRGGVWLVNCDTDRWKEFEHARWMTAEGKPGAAYLYGQMSDEERKYADRRMPRDAKDHFAFAKHLTAEIQTEEVVRGKLVRSFRVKPGRVQNHYFDASYLADVAGAMQGVRLLGHATLARSSRRRGPTSPPDEIGAR